MWGSLPVQEEAAQTRDAVKQRTPRQMPNIWPDMRPKPPPRPIITDDEAYVEIAAKLRVCLRS